MSNSTGIRSLGPHNLKILDIYIILFCKVYAIWMEWLAGLTPDVRAKITHFMYDDMCHLRVNIKGKSDLFKTIVYLLEICMQDSNGN